MMRIAIFIEKSLDTYLLLLLTFIEHFISFLNDNSSIYQQCSHLTIQKFVSQNIFIYLTIES